MPLPIMGARIVRQTIVLMSLDILHHHYVNGQNYQETNMKRMTGHNTFISKPGAKRVGYAHSDTWCTGFFPTDKTDVTELENDLVEDAHRLQSRLQGLTTQPMAKLEN